MEFITHAIAWCKGEIFEGRMVLLFGLAVFAVAIASIKVGNTPGSRALFVPLLLVGLLAIAGGITMNISNSKRIKAYPQAYSENADTFIQSEKKRVEEFTKWYPYTMYTFSIVMIIGIGIFLFIPTPKGRAIGLACMLLGFFVLYLDHFSEGRAHQYYLQILEYTK